MDGNEQGTGRAMSRAAFEAWAKTFGLNLQRGEDSEVVALNGYYNWLTQAHWVGWQAATARAEGVVEALAAFIAWGNSTGANMDALKDIHTQACQALAAWEEGK